MSGDEAAPKPQDEVTAPYIGARISLISNSNIRYEGTLFTVDPKEATVTLESVKCFGTEGRSEGSEVAGSSDVYEYIIFAGKDIKDLNVMTSQPEEKPAPAPLQDPAIMSHGATANQNAYMGPNPAFRPDYSGLPPGGYPPGAYGNDQFRNNFEFPGPEPAGPPGWNARPLPPQQQGKGGNSRNRKPHTHAPSGDAEDYSGPGTGGFLHLRRKKQADDGPAPDGEFDFQDSNARFDKEQYLTAVNKAKDDDGDADAAEGEDPEVAALGFSMEQVAQIKPAYDKTKSFFDEISTDRDSRSNGYSMAQEKRTNVETFGDSAQSYRSFDYRRQRKGGGKGKGGHRGGKGGQRGGKGGFNRNNNNNRQENNDGFSNYRRNNRRNNNRGGQGGGGAAAGSSGATA